MFRSITQGVENNSKKGNVIITVEDNNKTSSQSFASLTKNRLAEGMNTMIKEKFLTLRWNNILTLGIGLITLIYVGVVLSATVLSDVAAFIGLVLLGAVY